MAKCTCPMCGKEWNVSGGYDEGEESFKRHLKRHLGENAGGHEYWEHWIRYVTTDSYDRVFNI